MAYIKKQRSLPEVDEGEFQLKQGETLDGKDYREYMKSVIFARNDPVYFIEDLLGFPGPDEHGNERHLFPVQEHIVKEFYKHKYNPEFDPYKKMVYISGQRSGKSALVSTLMAYELFEVISWENPARHFGLMTGKSGKGATITLTCVATSRNQANLGVFTNMQNLIEGNEWFEQWFDLNCKNEMIYSESKDVVAQVIAPKASTAAGFTNKCVIFDELDFFQESETLIDVYSVYDKLSNSTETFKRNGKIIAISSLNTMSGIMMKEYNETLKESRKPKPFSIGFNYKTWEVNPNLTREYLLDSCGGNLSKFFKDFANQPEAAGGKQFEDGVRTNKNIRNVLYEDFNDLNADILNHRRVISLDPAWKNDRFGIACGYHEHNNIVVDGVRAFSNMGDKKSKELKAYLRPSEVRAYIDSIIDPLNIDSFVCDVSNLAPELCEYLEFDVGLSKHEHITNKEDFDRWKELQEGIYHTQLDIVHDEELEEECNGLIIQQTRGGKTKVNHLHGKGKDLADAVANVIWYFQASETDYNYTPLGTMIFV